MDIISLPIEYDKKKIDGNYRLVIAAVKRAKDLSQGSLPKISSKAKKITTLALEEVAKGAVSILTGEAAITANEEAKKLVHKRMMDEAQQKETLPEDLTELEKDLKFYLSEKGESEQKRTIEDIFGES
ncbi:MAG: DNA-directed RNA polymerase subunit omega [Nitrospirae bacterium]|nr:DNA-directed RNA polymerase subunit omega [Nitrospirota bacterium]